MRRRESRAQFFCSIRAARAFFRRDRQFQSPPRRRDDQGWPQLCGHPPGLGLDGPEHGGMLAWRGAPVATCNFKLVVLGISRPLLTFGVTVSF
jgi:hypothetical protein